jgi:hypothetical protein
MKRHPEIEQTAVYSIVRLAPDPVRQEFVNVAVVVASVGNLSIRALPEVTAHVRAIAPPEARRLIPDLEPMLGSLLSGVEPIRSLTRLATEDGLSGFEFTAPRRLVIDARYETASLVAERLYSEYVAPRRWAPERTRGPHLDSLVKRTILSASNLERSRLAVGLRIRTPLLEYSFPLAFANGRATIVQGVDLAVSEYRQEEHTLGAIARIAEATRVLPLEPNWITLVKPGENSARFRRRLGGFSQVLGIGQIDELVGMVAREAERPIEALFELAGVKEVERHETEVEIVLNRT